MAAFSGDTLNSKSILEQFFRRRKRFKRSDEEKRVLSAYFGGDPAAIDAADGLFRQQQQPHYPGITTFLLKNTVFSHF